MTFGKGAPKIPKPPALPREHMQPHERARREREELEALDRLAMRAWERKQQDRRNWRVFWWSCALVTCCAYWLWWLWPAAEPLTWTWRG